MIKLKFRLGLLLLLWSALLSGADLKINWREGKDNLYNHPARLQVTFSETGKAAANADVYRGEELLGKTDSHGELSTTALNSAAVKYSLKACLEDKCSDKTVYQVLASEYAFPAFNNMGEDPSTSMSFTWHTAVQIKGTITECIIAGDKDGFQSPLVIRSKGISYPKELIDLDKPEGKKFNVSIHKTTVKDLSPDTRYNYRVGDGKYWMEGSFQTAPAKDSREAVKFLFVADSQESSRENYQSFLKSVLNKAFTVNPDIRFIVHAGDMVNRGMNGQEWQWYFEAGEKYFRNSPLASNVGNHETGGVVTNGPQQKNKAYLDYFNNPSNHTGTFAEGSAYSFNYGAAHLVCLDNQSLNDAMDVKLKTGNGSYLQSALHWLKKDLEFATAQKKWKIVTMHQPIYGANRDETELREVLAPVFDSCKVDLVITGHDHYYFRSFPIRYDPLKNDGEVVPIDQFGTVYLIGGSTCAKMYPQKFARPYQAVVMAKEDFPGRYPYLRSEPLAQQNYSTFSVTRERLHYQFFDRNGNKKDDVVLHRDTTTEMVADNGTLTLKLDLTRGGAISWLSLSGSSRSVVNIADEGRYIQQSYYAGKSLDRKAEGQAPRWSPWSWNPIQVGDAFRNRAQIIDFKKTGNELYVKCIPMQWDMNNKPAEAEMEQWTTLNGNVLEVRNRLTCHRTDNIYGDSILCDQELPAVYPVSALQNLYSYQGTAPFTGAPAIRLPVKNLSSGFWGIYEDLPENWMAFTDDTGWGMAVYNPLCKKFLAGMSGVPGKEAADGSTSYIAPVKKEVLYKNSVYEYRYYILIGKLEEMRGKIYSIKEIKN